MMQIALAKIVADKAVWVGTRKQQQLLANFQNEAQPSTRYFHDALQSMHTAFILEYKRTSSSKGVIRDDSDPARIAAIYKHYASAISVLADEKYSQGSFNFLPTVSQIAPRSILCKNFITDPYQIYLARYYQTGARLSILSVLDGDQYRQLTAVVHSLEMGVLTEVSNEEEQGRTIALGAKAVGINSRDLHDLSVDLNRIRELAPKPGHSVTVVSVSGINAYAQMRGLNHLANGSLTGSALMAHDDLHAAVRRVLLGENKVCDPTRGQGAKAAYDVGAIYSGLIFAVASPCYANAEQAQEVMTTTPLQYVNVFRNHDTADVVDKTKVLSLAAVQLHGNREWLYTNTLREALLAHIVIWKVLGIGETPSARESQHVDKYILGNGQGRSGQRFDQSLLNGQSLNNILLTGGLGTDSCVEAVQTGCVGLDFNSAVKPQSGIKDTRLLVSVFQTLRAY